MTIFVEFCNFLNIQLKYLEILSLSKFMRRKILGIWQVGFRALELAVAEIIAKKNIFAFILCNE